LPTTAVSSSVLIANPEPPPPLRILGSCWHFAVPNRDECGKARSERKTVAAMDGGGERESTKHEAEAEYHCHDFEWEDLRADVEANPSLSHHLSPFSTTTASPPPPSSEAWRSFHRRHASGKFFKVTPPSPFVKARSLVPFMRR
jgi:hypothetical protein